LPNVPQGGFPTTWVKRPIPRFESDEIEKASVEIMFLSSGGNTRFPWDILANLDTSKNLSLLA
jgi:hypothetical protein